MLALLTLPRAHAAAQTEAVLSEIAAALDVGEIQKAEQLATSALADDSLTSLQQSRLLLDRGLAQERQGANDLALLDLTKAIEIHALPPTEQALALFERGMALDALGRLADALGDYDAAVRISPGSPPALNNRANVYRRIGHFEEARRDYLASLAAGNSLPEYSYYGLGQIAEALGDVEAARGYYAKAFAANPAYKLAADRLEALGGPPEASVADSGVIMLHPPKSRGDTATIALKPLPAVPRAFVPVPARPVQSASGEFSPASYRGSSYGGESMAVALRPAIIGETAGGAHGGQAQLGAWRQEAEAAEGWNCAVRLAAGSLAGLSPRIVAVDLPGRGRYYRLRVIPDGAAVSLCKALAAKSVECLPVRD